MNWEQRFSRNLPTLLASAPRRSPPGSRAKSSRRKGSNVSHQDGWPPSLGWGLGPFILAYGFSTDYLGVSESNAKNGSWATEFLPQNKLLGSQGKSGCPQSAVPPARGSARRSWRRRLQRPPRPSGGKLALTRPSSRDPPRSPTPRSQPPPRRLGDDFGKLGEATFPGDPGGREEGSRSREEEKQKGTRTKSSNPGGPGSGARAGRWWTASPLRGNTKAPPRVVGGKARRDRPALPRRPRAVTPGSEGQDPRPRAGAASSGVPGPGTVRASRGAGEGVRAEYVRALPRVRRRGDRAHFQRPRECPGAVRASCGRAGWERRPNASGAEPGTHRVRPGAHSQLRRHGQSRREPKRARSPGRCGAPPRPPTLLKRGDQV